MNQTLQIYSIFSSIDGECNDYGQGALTTFIRFAGCNLRCQYPCDTPNSLKNESGLRRTLDQIMEGVSVLPTKKVTITGGEPLLQMEGLLYLVQRLKTEGYYISIETNGSINPCMLMRRVDCLIVDYKLPSSGEEAKMDLSIFPRLRAQDYCKFVISDRQDFDAALAAIKKFGKYSMKLAFSPVWGRLDSKTLIEWMSEAKIPMAILSLQLHKIIQLSEPQ